MFLEKKCENLLLKISNPYHRIHLPFDHDTENLSNLFKVSRCLNEFCHKNYK